MRELTIKIKFEEDCLGYNEDIPFSVECILNKYIKLDLEEDQIVKKGWTVEVTETVKCKYCAIISQGAAYMVCDENDNIIGYADTLGMIDYDTDFKPITYKNNIEIISVDETAWG